MGRYFKNPGSYIALIIGMIILVFIINTGFKAYSQSQRKNEIKEEKNFNRPEPSKPVKPVVPSENRYQEDKVFLEYADSLYKVDSRDTVVKQILKGNVKFRQSGLWMYCDSAYYYPDENSLDAFSNVRMEQGDTLFVYADKLFYNGDEHLARLRNGATRNKVTLINKDVTLTTDSLNYDTHLDLGWYIKWGTIQDDVNTLTSLYGQYSPKTKMAEFFKDVVLVNHKDGFTMYTDTLYYNTSTHIANIESRTEIQSENDTIITNLATYYTDSGDADLLSRSTIIHRDSTGNVTTLEGDSIIYDNATRISRAYMFRDPFKRSTPMVITDTAQKTTLIGGFGIYNDSTKEALATIYPLLMEYSQKDTLFLRADTIKTFIITEMIAGKKRRITKSGFPEYKGIPIVMRDSLNHVWLDSVYFKSRIPFVDSPLEMLRNVAPPVEKKDNDVISEIDIPVKDSDKEQIEVIEDEESVVFEEKKDLVFDSEESQVSEMGIGDIISEVEDQIENVKVSESNLTLSQIENVLMNEDEETSEKDEEIEDEIKVDSIAKEFHVILAYHRGRFFKQDMQGVADSMVFVERDSMLYMFRKPIIWSEERQVTGNRIDVHFNDSTTDWAYLPEFGLMSEYVDEDFYNQIYGKEITAFFADQGLRRMNVSGNVETIFLPQESDSTFNRLVNAESSYMDVYLNDNQLDWLKMWPEVSGTVTPIFLVKRNQMYLQKFKWWGFLRPEREWYGNRIKWADNLGEVPDELEQYFMTPSDFGEPKSFTGPRIVIPTSSLILDGDISKDSLINSSNLEVSSDVPGIEKAEKTETLEDIELSEIEQKDNAEDTEIQTADIEEAVIKAEETDEIPSEEADINTQEEEDLDE